MRILVTHRYYWPDRSACSGIMRWVARRLANDGHDVEVLTSQPSYRDSSKQQRRPNSERLDEVSVKRISLPTEAGSPFWRVVNAIHLGVRILLKSLCKRYDVIIVTTIPPVLGGFFSALAARLTRARLIYYCMDLHPEIGRFSGDFSNPIIFSVLRRLDDWTCRAATPVLVHSEDMGNTLRQRPRGHEYRIEVLNNFALPVEHPASVSAGWKLEKKNTRLKLIYAGNMGRFQGLDVLLDAMEYLVHREDIELIMMGEGVVKSKLIAKQKKTNANVRFFNYQSAESVKIAIQNADIGVVALIPGMFRYAYPSKTMAYLEQGRPIVALVEPYSELAKRMNAEGYGVSVPTTNPWALARSLEQLADDSSWRESMSRAAFVAYDKYFSAPVVLAKWSQLVGGPCRSS